MIQAIWTWLVPMVYGQFGAALKWNYVLFVFKNIIFKPKKCWKMFECVPFEAVHQTECVGEYGARWITAIIIIQFNTFGKYSMYLHSLPPLFSLARYIFVKQWHIYWFGISLCAISLNSFFCFQVQVSSPLYTLQFSDIRSVIILMIMIIRELSKVPLCFMRLLLKKKITKYVIEHAEF